MLKLNRCSKCGKHMKGQIYTDGKEYFCKECYEKLMKRESWVVFEDDDGYQD